MLILLFFLSITSAVIARDYHVSVNGIDSNDGTASKPFKTISAASLIAQPGDVIIVHAGTYREWINPARGGESDSKRIVYQAAQGEKAEIKGDTDYFGNDRSETDPSAGPFENTDRGRIKLKVW